MFLLYVMGANTEKRIIREKEREREGKTNKLIGMAPTLVSYQ